MAVTERAVVIETWHEPTPEQGVDHPTNVEFGPGLANSVTVVPEANTPEHETVQLMPAGDDVTVPAPDPASDTESVWVGCTGGGGGMYSSLSGSPQHSLSTPSVALALMVAHT